MTSVRDRDPDRARILADRLRHALADTGIVHHTGLALELALELESVNCDFTHAAEVARDLAAAFADALGHDVARDLARVRGFDYSRTRDHDRDLLRTVTGDSRRDPSREAEVLCYAAARLYVLLESMASRSDTAPPRARVSTAAVRVTAVAATLLPAADRARYREEFAGELFETAGVSRRAQWRYALGVMATAWPLRRCIKRAGKSAAWQR